MLIVTFFQDCTEIVKHNNQSIIILMLGCKWLVVSIPKICIQNPRRESECQKQEMSEIKPLSEHEGISETSFL